MFTGLVSIAVIVAVLGSLRAHAPPARPHLALARARRGRVRAGGARRAHGAVRPRAAVRDGALPRVDRAARRRDRAALARGPTRRPVACGREPAHGRRSAGCCSASCPWCCSPARSSPARARTAVAGSTTTSAGSTSRSPTSARIHGVMVFIFLALVLGMLWLVRRDRAPHAVQTWVTVLLVVLRRAGRASGTCSTSATSRRCSSASTSRARPRCSPRRCASTSRCSRSRRAHRRPSRRCHRRRACSRPRERCARLLRCRRRSASTAAGTSRSRPSSSGRRSSRPTGTASGGRGSRSCDITPADAGDAGTPTGRRRRRVVIQAPLPYQLHCVVHIDEAEPARRLVAHVTGDLQGPARLELTPTATGTSARMAWTLDVQLVVAPTARDHRAARARRGPTTASSNAGSCSSRRTRSTRRADAARRRR